MLSDESKAALHLFFIRAGRHMGRGIHELGISPGEARVIRTIHMQGGEEGMNPSAVSEALGVRQPTLTPIFNALEEKGYIVRVRDSADRRKVCISLTDKCRQDLEVVFSKGRHFMSRLEECLTPEEIEQLIAIMKKVDEFIRCEHDKNEKGRGHPHGHHRPLP